jgi:hypothetical protein
VAISAVALGGSVAPAAAVPAAATDTAVFDCFGAAVVKPKEIVLTCANGIIRKSRARIRLDRVASAPPQQATR